MPSTEDDDVVASYEAANRAFIDAAAIPDPEFPAIAETHTGPMLDQRRAVLRALEIDGRVIRYPTNSRYRVVIESVETSNDDSRIQFCAVDDGQRVDAQTEAPEVPCRIFLSWKDAIHAQEDRCVTADMRFCSLAVMLLSGGGRRKCPGAVG